MSSHGMRQPSKLRHRPKTSLGASEPKTTSTHQAAKIIDGKALAKEIRQQVKEGTEWLNKEHGVSAGLGVVLVGDRPDSRTYVNLKKKAASEVGIKSYDIMLPANTTQAELLQVISTLNADKEIHAILVQLPLPSHIDSDQILASIEPSKDVDGFGPMNVGRLCLYARELLEMTSSPLEDGSSLSSSPSSSSSSSSLCVMPCTALGVIAMLQSLNMDFRGKSAVVVGRSRIVGTPVAALLQALDCTVTTIHSHTADPQSYLSRADIVVAAVGKPEFVKAEWLKPGAVVIDVGINHKEDPTAKKGFRIVGDVDFENAKHVSSSISPVPGGVGPMTVAMLLKNTLNLARASVGLKPMSIFR